MSPQTASAEPTRYLLQGGELAEVLDFMAEVSRRGTTVPEPEFALVSANGTQLEVPGSVLEAFLRMATEMACGQGVTVMPQNALLTTQEAAELLGISRSAVVCLLEDGEIPYERQGQHRRVLPSDLLSYGQRMRLDRLESLERMVRESEASGLYELTSGPPPQTR